MKRVHPSPHPQGYRISPVETPCGLFDFSAPDGLKEVVCRGQETGMGEMLIRHPFVWLENRFEGLCLPMLRFVLHRPFIIRLGGCLEAVLGAHNTSHCARAVVFQHVVWS